MNSSIIKVLLLLMLTNISMAQPSIHWERSYGGSSLEKLYALKATLDNGYIVCGSTFSSDGDVGTNKGGADCWIVKIKADGSLSWARNYGGEATDLPYDICCLNDGGFAFVGLTYSTGGDIQGNHGDTDVWVVRLDPVGNILWQKCLGGSKRDVGYGLSSTNDGSLIICGTTKSSDGDITSHIGYSDVWLIKLTSLGQLEWENCLGGINGDDIAYQIESTTDGGFIFFGETNSSDGQVSGHNGNDDCWLVKVNSVGELEWQKALGGFASDRGWDIHPAKNGDYYLMGYAGSPNGDVIGWHGNNDYWIIKISPAGNIIWQRCMGGYNDDFGLSVFGTQDGGCIASGATTSTDGDVLDNDGFRDIWVVKLDSLGIEMWQKTLGGSSGEFSTGVIETHDGNYVIAGEAYSSDGDVSSNQGSSDFWIVKLAPETSTTSAPTAIPLSLYPNPATHWITLNLPIIEQDMQVNITDEQGKLLQSRTIRTDEKLNISALPPGVYWVYAVSKSGQVYAGKFVKG
ncbi:MAG TPA: T9SS type A sorting domain-containing protein [Saprospiraceae bacterium]|nr:T9SS type A sorting domain-containing protein [Saprospiraceae bacterium]